MTDSTTKPKRAGPPRSDLFDELWRMIETKLDDLLADALPQMGTVTGSDGGTVKVRLDDEDVDREVGFPAAKGVKYETGQRVLTHKTKGGDRMVQGRVDGSTNQSAVDTAQLYPNSVTRDEIKNGEVTNDHLSGGVAKGKLEVPVQRSLDKADSALQDVPGDVVRRDELNKATADFITKRDLPDTSGLETKDSHKTDIDKINKRLDKLEKKK